MEFRNAKALITYEEYENIFEGIPIFQSLLDDSIYGKAYWTLGKSGRMSHHGAMQRWAELERVQLPGLSVFRQEVR